MEEQRWNEVTDEELLKELEKTRQRKSGIREFLESTQVGKWYVVEYNRGAVSRVAKQMGIKVHTTERKGKTFVFVVEKP